MDTHTWQPGATDAASNWDGAYVHVRLKSDASKPSGQVCALAPEKPGDFSVMLPGHPVTDGAPVSASAAPWPSNDKSLQQHRDDRGG